MAARPAPVDVKEPQGLQNGHPDRAPTAVAMNGILEKQVSIREKFAPVARSRKRVSKGE